MRLKCIFFQKNYCNYIQEVVYLRTFLKQTIHAYYFS